MDVNALAEDIANHLARVDGVAAVVVGGSRGRGTAASDSDLDLGIYYSPVQPLDIAALNRTAADWDDSHQNDLLTPIGGWGPWINGGGWLHINGLAVDFIYRDLDKVRKVIGDCHKGIISMDYQAGHPHGFASHIYMGEVATCQVLHDPTGALSELRQRTDPYPRALRRAVIDTFFWEADFAVQGARKGAVRGDSAYVAGSLFRGLACLLQTLFALNSVYWLNEKGALELADGFLLKPPNLRATAEQVFSGLTAEPDALYTAVDRLESLISTTRPMIVLG